MIELAQDETLTFGYGSNMKLEYLRESCPAARSVMLASLPNYRIEFRRYSDNMKGGISTIMEAPGCLVQGILFAVRKAELEALDELEDIPLGLYRRDSFRVLGADGNWHLGDLYRVVNAAGPFVVADPYLSLMEEGAREQGLSEDYRAKISACRGKIAWIG